MHAFSHGGGERVVDWTAVMSQLLQVLLCDFESIGVDFGVWQEMKEEEQKPMAKHAADSSSSVAVVLDGQVCDHSPLCIFSIPPSCCNSQRSGAK